MVDDKKNAEQGAAPNHGQAGTVAGERECLPSPARGR